MKQDNTHHYRTVRRELIASSATEVESASLSWNSEMNVTNGTALGLTFSNVPDITAVDHRNNRDQRHAREHDQG